MRLSSHRNVLGQLEKLLFVTLFNLEGTGPWERCGDIAQLGERLPCKQEVAGSIPTISTSKIKNRNPVLIGTKPSETGSFRRRRGKGAECSFRRRRKRNEADFASTRARSSAG